MSSQSKPQSTNPNKQKYGGNKNQNQNHGKKPFVRKSQQGGGVGIGDDDVGGNGQQNPQESMFHQQKKYQQQQQHQHQQQQHGGKNYNKQERVQEPKQKTKQVADGNSFITIGISQYIEGVNSMPLSMDALAMANYLGVSNINLLKIAVKEAITFLEALRGTNIDQKARSMLIYYNIGLAPSFNASLRESVAYIKWILTASAKHKNFTDDFASLVGLLAGVCLYFNEIDLLNKQAGKYTKHFENLVRNYSVNEF